MTDPSVSSQAYQYFEQEATELLQTMNGDLQTLRQDFSVQKVHNLMRAAHTLKGASASVGLDTIKKTTHSLEDVFRALCHQDTVISVEMERLIFEGFECLQLLMSAQLAGAKVDGADILDRMATVVTQLQKMLGDRFGQGGHLPTSSELGFDMTQSIFELGVAQRLEALSGAVNNPDPQELLVLLKTQAGVFNGLGESLKLPGFQAIAQATLNAIAHQPEQILHIAPVALENFKVAHAAVLKGDRTQGGSPSAALKQFCAPSYKGRDTATGLPSLTAKPVTTINPPAPQAQRGNWLQRRWKKFTHSEAASVSNPPRMAPHSPAGDTLPTAATESSSVESNSAGPNSAGPSSAESSSAESASNVAASNISTSPNAQQEVQQKTQQASPKATEFTESDLAELAPTDLGALNISPEASSTGQPASQPASQLASDQSPWLEPTLTPELAPSLQLPDIEPSSTPEPSSVTEPSSTTIRMSVDHLDQLNQAMGELLTQQNRQTLYNQQLKALIKRLLNRISQQQQQLNLRKDQALIDNRSAHPLSASPLLNRPAYDTRFDALELDDYSELQLVVQSCLEESVQQSESAEAIELFVRRSEEALDKQKRLLTNTRETLLEARMVPLETIFEQFPPAIERLQAQHDKQVEITLEGGDVLIDKAIADNLYEPLLHLVRNAFDHGIEPAKERLLQNKLIGGNITLKGEQQGRHLLISVQDDGQGFDLDVIRQKALKKQLITPAEALALTPEQTVELLFKVGFSTLDEANTLSGRGVGLDAVQARVRSLQGWVTASHTQTSHTQTSHTQASGNQSSGACFTLHIPASLTIAKLLLCQAKGRIYALIADAVEHIVIPTAQQVRVWKGGKMITWQAREEEHLVPINALDEVLHYASPLSHHGTQQPLQPLADRRLTTPSGTGPGGAQATHTRPVILLRHQNALVGLEVDQLLGEQELVISPLGETVVPPPYLYGSSILPDGQLTLVLDGLMLAKIITKRRQSNFKPPTPQGFQTDKSTQNKPIFLKKLILTIDDSITMRTTLTETLQKANYQVIQACDGAEALQLLERYPDVQAILCDIEMPGMNGFEFLKARQRTPAIANIPTVMLTSRAGTKHRLLTEELGASGYLTKPYLTPQLLKTVAQAIENQQKNKRDPSEDTQAESLTISQR